VYSPTAGQVEHLNAESNPICHLLALSGAHHILHVSRVRVNNVLILAYWSKVYNSLTKTDTIRMSYLRPYPPMATVSVETVVSVRAGLCIRAAS
jgi:hypothetical protein